MRESRGGKPVGVMKVKAAPWRPLWREPLPSPRGGGASSTDPCVTLWRDLSESVPVATRKMVNYA